MDEGVSTLRNPGIDWSSLEFPPMFPTCPITGETFLASVSVEYDPTEDVIEYVEFEEWLRLSTTLTTMTVEELAVMVMVQVKKLLGQGIRASVNAKVVASKHCTATASVYNGGMDE